jgi:RNA polymerase sigma factor (sigma-70 family)
MNDFARNDESWSAGDAELQIIEDISKRLRCDETFEQAAQDWFEFMNFRVYQFAKREIGRKLHVRIDADDVVQTSFRTLFRRLKSDPGSTAEDLMGYTMKIVLNKVRKHARLHRRRRRDIQREEPGSSKILESGKKLPVRMDCVRIRDAPSNQTNNGAQGVNDSNQQNHACGILGANGQAVDQADQLRKQNLDILCGDGGAQVMIEMMQAGVDAEQAMAMQELILSIPEELRAVLDLSLCGCTVDETALALNTYPKKVTRQRSLLRDFLLRKLK